MNRRGFLKAVGAAASVAAIPFAAKASGSTDAEKAERLLEMFRQADQEMCDYIQTANMDIFPKGGMWLGLK